MIADRPGSISSVEGNRSDAPKNHALYLLGFGIVNIMDKYRTIMKTVYEQPRLELAIMYGHRHKKK